MSSCNDSVWISAWHPTRYLQGVVLFPQTQKSPPPWSFADNHKASEKICPSKKYRHVQQIEIHCVLLLYTKLMWDKCTFLLPTILIGKICSDLYMCWMLDTLKVDFETSANGLSHWSNACFTWTHGFWHETGNIFCNQTRFLFSVVSFFLHFLYRWKVPQLEAPLVYPYW